MTSVQPGLDPSDPPRHVVVPPTPTAPGSGSARPSPPAMRALHGVPGTGCHAEGPGHPVPWALVLDEVGARLGAASARARAGYRAEQVVDAEQLLAILRHRAPDAVVLDTTDEGHSLALLRRIRDLSDVAVLVLGAPSSEALVEVVRTGAADSLRKPFTSAQLARRLAALCRAARRPRGSLALTDGYLELGRDKDAAVVDGTPITLTTTEWELLATLLAHPGQALGLPELLEGCGAEDCSLERVRFVLLRLRRKLGQGDLRRSPLEVVDEGRFSYRRPR